MVCPLWFYFFLNILIALKYTKKNIKTYCVNCRKSTENKKAKVIKTKNGRLQMRSHCSICGNKKSRFVKEQEAKGILSTLGTRSPLSRIPGLNILF